MITLLQPTSTTDRTRAFVATWLAGVPVVQAKPRVQWQFTDEQYHGRALQEAAMRNADRRKVFEARSGSDERRKA